MARYYGNVYDTETSAPIQSATVDLIRNGNVDARTLTDAQGGFGFNTMTPADQLRISCVGYKTFTTPASEYQHSWELERDYRNVDPVVLPPYPQPGASGNKWMFPALALLALLFISKQKR